MSANGKKFVAKIDASSIRSFCASLHLVQKVGRDLIFEVEEAGLTLRGLNDSKSSFISIEFLPAYFDVFEMFQEPSFSCRLPVKPICLILRNLKHLQFVVVSGDQSGPDHSLSFELHMQNGVVRMYKFCFEDCDVLNAVCDESECSLVKLRPKIMAQMLEHLHRSPEVQLVAQDNLFAVKSFHQTDSSSLASASNGKSNAIKTGLSVNVQEFDDFQFRSTRQAESLVFCVKEVSAFVGFCEALELANCFLYFSEGGRPIKFCANLECLRVSLIMATIAQPLQGVDAGISNPRVSVQPQRDDAQEQEEDGSPDGQHPVHSSTTVPNPVRDSSSDAGRSDQTEVQNRASTRPRGLKRFLESDDEDD